MTEKTAYKFCYQPLGNGVQDAMTGYTENRLDPTDGSGAVEHTRALRRLWLNSGGNCDATTP